MSEAGQAEHRLLRLVVVAATPTRVPRHGDRASTRRNLTPWGQRFFNGANGIKSTAVTAKIYGGVQPTTPAPTTPAPTHPDAHHTDPDADPRRRRRRTPAPGKSCTAALVVATPGPAATRRRDRQGRHRDDQHLEDLVRPPAGGSVPERLVRHVRPVRTTVTVSNAAWNGLLGAGASTTYGFVGSGTAPSSSAAVTCAAS